MSKTKATSNTHPQLQIGDIVFTKIPVVIFKEVANATKSWTNHVGIIVETSGDEPLVAESTFPVAKCTPLGEFIKRSDEGRHVISRINRSLTTEEQTKLMQAALRRMGIFYGTGFNLEAKRQFCSRFVYEVVEEATGMQIGEIETFSDLLGQNPEAKLGFWRLWFLGRIPWERKTITPASVFKSELITHIYKSHPDL